MLIHAAAACLIIIFDPGFYVRHLGQRSILYISKVLADGDHVGVMIVEVGEIREIGVPVNGVDLTGN
jgi:hypothetical protein